MNHDRALALVRETITEIAPDADLTDIGPDDSYRETLELDSLDFLAVVERLSERSGCRIDEDDYPKLATIGGAAALLSART